jgi:hypothetical protein
MARGQRESVEVKINIIHLDFFILSIIITIDDRQGAPLTLAVILFNIISIGVIPFLVQLPPDFKATKEDNF